jgi:succinate-acetate transporter protein
MSCNTQENYDPKSNVCTNQDDFNHALKSALKKIDKDNMKKEGSVMYLYLVPWLIFLLWALILAMRVPEGPNKVVHIILAVLFSPLYVIASLVGVAQQSSSM